ncbi:MAG: zinc-binding alcohol dehydrogenase family protein [Ignavibacteriaceae bacterium]
MKAAVLNQLGSSPVYENVPDPIPKNDEQILISVEAVALKNFDKLRAEEGNYISYSELPVIVGSDGVGILEDGTRIYAQGITGMMAKKALITKNRYTILPDGIDIAVAAALPNAAIGSAMALQSRGKFKSGNVVMINGATGVTGQMAVQLAKHYGASKIIATGRNEKLLQKLKTLGADEIISLKQDGPSIIQQIKEIHKHSPIDIVIDYLWGEPIELIIQSIRVEGINLSPHKVKVVTVGEMAGHNIALNSGDLRSADIELLGSGSGTFLPKELKEFSTKILPEMFALAATGKLKIEIQKEKLENIETVWNNEVDGKRTVIMIN